jgi:hypothetical protein
MRGAELLKSNMPDMLQPVPLVQGFKLNQAEPSGK